MQVQPIAVTFTLPQDSLSAITQAMGKHPLEVVAYASDDKTSSIKYLLTVDNAINVATGTIKAKATFPNRQHALGPDSSSTPGCRSVSKQVWWRCRRRGNPARVADRLCV